MAISSNRKQHINVRSSQMDIADRPSLGSSDPTSEDFTGKLQEAQQQLELLQKQQAEVERQRIELQELRESKEEFINGQVELHEKLTSALTAMDREIFATQQEAEELQQARTCFADHLEKINQLDAKDWSNDTLHQELTRAMSVLDLAEDEYEQALAHFSGGRSASVFGIQSAKTKRTTTRTVGTGEFASHFRNGLAFNLPIVILGSLALLIYLIK